MRAGPAGIHFLFPFAEWLGIKDLSKPDYGDPVVCQPGDVPVFWPSQMTSLEAVSSCSMSGLEGGGDYDPGWKQLGLQLLEAQGCCAVASETESQNKT